MKTNYLFFVLVFFLLIPAHIAAQITIGDTGNPQKGAILDLTEDSDANTSANSKKGMLLPRVNLKQTNKLEIQGNTENLTGKETKHTGLTVYNLMDDNGELCEGPYVWTGLRWVRMWGNCEDCEYTIIGKDGKEYYIYCLDFTGTPAEAIARCKQSDVTNPDGEGGNYTYHLMTYDEYRQIWPNPEKGTSDYKFSSGVNYLMQYSTNVNTANGWLTVGKVYNDGSYDWGEAVGVARSKKTDAAAMNQVQFSGGLPVGASLTGTHTIRCVRTVTEP